MLDRLAGFTFSAGLAALGVLVQRPDLYGPGASQVPLGPFESLRMLLAVVLCGMAVFGMIRAVLPRKRYRRPESGPIAFEDDMPSSQAGLPGGSATPSPLW